MSSPRKRTGMFHDLEVRDFHRPLPSGVPIHSNFDAAGIRVAEYRFNPGTGFSALLRE